MKFINTDNPKYNKFAIGIVCNGFSKYLDVSLHYWNEMNYPKDKYKIFICTSEKDKKTIEVISKYSSSGNICPIIHKGDNFHNKGLLMKEIYDLASIYEPEYMFFTDADIIFHNSTLIDIFLLTLNNKYKIMSSIREDIDESDTQKLFGNFSSQNYNWVWDNLKRKIVHPSPYMGWCLICDFDCLKNIKFDIDHKGYDEVDWKLLGQILEDKRREKIIRFIYPPLHIYHGPKGSTWSGVQVE